MPCFGGTLDETRLAGGAAMRDCDCDASSCSGDCRLEGSQSVFPLQRFSKEAIASSFYSMSWQPREPRVDSCPWPK